MEQANLGSIAVQQVGGATVITLRGEHDIATAPMLEEAILDAHGVGPVIIDLTDAAFIDSVIITLIVRQSNPDDHASAWCRLAVVTPPEGFVTNVLRLVSAEVIVPIFQQVSYALASMAAADVTP
jgi:anti-anti-sigma factor